MHELSGFLLRHGYMVLGGFVLAEQSGIPIPSVPLLLVMGALSAEHKFSFLAAWGISILAATIGDALWYALGVYRGSSILKLLCRISLEPDSCVSGVKKTFARWGAFTLLFSKFVPGFGTVAPTMAGWTRIPRWRVLSSDLAGSMLWAGAYLGAGAIFRSELEVVGALLSRLGGWVVSIAALAAAAWLGWKYYQRRKFIRSLHVDRVKPHELMRMMELKEAIVIVDLRHSLEIENEPGRIPGSISVDPEDIEQSFPDLPLDREVILYCS
jgi:membrane protein DedA with SNARE-associated domain